MQCRQAFVSLTFGQCQALQFDEATNAWSSAVSIGACSYHAVDEPQMFADKFSVHRDLADFDFASSEVDHEPVRQLAGFAQ